MDAHYLPGVTAALCGALLHAGANILDSYLSNRLSQRLSDLVALSVTMNLLFLPLSAAVDPPHWLSGSCFVLVVLISTINVFYHFPYYRALNDSDTSVVSSLFSLGKLFTPPLAFLVLRETLEPIQYVGFFVIVIASALLTFDRTQLRFKKALLYMLGVSFALVLQAVLFKKLYESGVSWGTSVVWSGVMDFVVASLLILSQGRARELGQNLRAMRSDGLLVLGSQFLTWTGEVLGLWALTLIPVSVFEGVGSAQPMFVLLLSLVFVRWLSHVLKENLQWRQVSGKLALFLLIAAGTFMIVRHE